MSELSFLNEAFVNFTAASKSLETYYGKLQERVLFLTGEVEEKNRQLQAALRETAEAKDYLRGILQSLREAIVVLDQEEKVTLINRAAADLFGLDAGHALGKSFGSLGLSVETKGADSVLRTRDRKYSVIISRSEVTDSLGSVRGHVILFQDITRIKELEALQERNQRLIAMGEMAARIVHEVRSPLCSIELYASMLARDLEGTGHIGLASGISNGIKSLNNILTNMIYFAKPQEPSLRPVCPAEVLEETLSMLMPMIGAGGISVSTEMDRTVKVQGDAELLKQVFLNIIMNALQATPQGKGIAICVKMENECAAVEIRDEGEGIAQEMSEAIFNPFFSTKEKGTGLGLAIASRIMQAHGGVIRVESEPGKGSCFQLRFPLREEETDVRRIFSEGVFS